MQYLCQACLRTGDNVSLMSVAEVNTFREFICKTSCHISEYYMCVYCRSLLRKLARFVSQCQSAQLLLRDAQDQQNTKSVPTAIPFYDLRCTTPSYAQVRSELAEETQDMEEESSRISDDEDDVPLVMLRAAGDSGQQQSQTTEQNGLGEREGEREKGERKRRKKKKHKQKKPLREGFTSRMVQETDEYLVIKLTMEQVREEMAARAAGERYRLAPFRCARCVKGFNFEDVLAAHMDKHSPKSGDLECPLCGQYCAGAVSLRGHMKCHTTRYQCKVCGLVRRSRQHVLEHHALQHAAAAARYCCSHCAFTTPKRTVMQHHARGHGAREPHACHRCGKLYKNLETLRIHITRHEESRRVRCALCPLSFVSAAQLQRHARAVHERRDTYCVECDLLFHSSDTLKLHFQKAKRHRDANSYKHKCGECSQQFISAATLATHARTAHGAPPAPRAPRAPRDRDAPRSHVRSAHPRKNPLPEATADAPAALAPEP